MQVTETSSQGLKRELKVVVGASELTERFNARLDEVKDNVQIKGFRKGKVPVGHLKRIYGRSVMAEVVQQALEDSSRKALTERNLRPAMQPKLTLTEDQAEIERVLSGQSDLAFDMAFEVLPEITLADFSAMKLERMTADVGEEEIAKALGDLAKRNVSYTAEEGRAAGDGDRVTMDFVGRIGGEAFEGGTGEGVPVVIGQGGFIPGFEDGLKGTRAGDAKVIEATFPAEYPVATLAGKAAAFDVTVKEVAAPKEPAIDDELAKGLGADSLEKLREMVSAQIQREFDAISRARLKRSLLDVLETSHDFPLPPSLVDQEFEQVWAQVNDGLKQSGKTFADEGKTEESAREEYRRIAERRVRLGLVIGEIGERNKIQVTQDEMRRALMEQARRFPGQEKFVYEYYEKTPGAVAQLRAPVFEDKVIDHIVEQAKPTDRKVSREELFKFADDEAAA